MRAPGTKPSPLCSDSRRAGIATVIAAVVPTVAGFVFGLLDPVDAKGSAITIVLMLFGWNLFAVCYVVLTLRTFKGADSTEFVALMAARTALRNRVWRRIDRRGDGPTFAIEAAIVAFGVVLVLPHIDAIEVDDWILVPVTLTILLSCWGLAVVAYALHYAERDLAEPGLEFPGTRTGAYGDYLYFSIAVATTFGATDVNITTPSMRRVVNLHTILTFIYNSVIVALLAALLIR